MFIAIGKNNEGAVVVLENYTTSHQTNLSIASKLSYVPAAVAGTVTSLLSIPTFYGVGLLGGQRDMKVLCGISCAVAQSGFRLNCAFDDDKLVENFNLRQYDPITKMPLLQQTTKFDRLSDHALDGLLVNATDGKKLETLYSSIFRRTNYLDDHQYSAQPNRTFINVSNAIKSYENRAALRETGLLADDSPSVSLLKARLEISFQPEPVINDSEFLAAVKISDKNKILDLLATGTNVNEVNENGNSALIIAAGIGNKDIVSTLLDKGANISLENKAGDCATTVAIKRGHADTASLLLENNGIPRGAFSEIEFQNIPKDTESVNKLIVLCATRGQLPYLVQHTLHGPYLDNSTNLFLSMLTQGDYYSNALRKSEPSAPNTPTQLREWTETQCALPDNLKRSYHLQQLIDSGVAAGKANILADAQLVRFYHNRELVADEIRQALYVRDFPYEPSVTEMYMVRLAAETIYTIDTTNHPLTEHEPEESRKMNELAEALLSLNKYHRTALAQKILTDENTDIKRDLASQRNAIKAKINSLEQVQTTEGETIELGEIGVLDVEMAAIARQEMIARKQILLDEESQISRNAIPRLSVLSLATVIENFETLAQEEIQDLALSSLENTQPSSTTEVENATQVSENAQRQRSNS